MLILGGLVLCRQNIMPLHLTDNVQAVYNVLCVWQCDRTHFLYLPYILSKLFALYIFFLFRHSDTSRSSLVTFVTREVFAVFIENMQENRHTFNIIAQVLPNVNNLQGLKKQFCRNFTLSCKLFIKSLNLFLILLSKHLFTPKYKICEIFLVKIGEILVHSLTLSSFYGVRQAIAVRRNSYLCFGVLFKS